MMVFYSRPLLISTFHFPVMFVPKMTAQGANDYQLTIVHNECT
jgi:hypothetical protein